jgi:uncharacterized glyoxalase superfamily protein PhnB
MPNAKTITAVIPALQYQDARAAIEFLCHAFGFEKKAVYEGEGGSIAHAELTLGNGMVMLGSVKDTEYGKLLVRPRNARRDHERLCHRRRRRCTLHARQSRRRRDHARAVTQDYGGRDYTCKDPEGHVWSFGTYNPWAPH